MRYSNPDAFVLPVIEDRMSNLRGQDGLLRRQLVDDILRPFGMDVFHWIFLRSSPRWVERTRTRTIADTIFYNISIDGLWNWREFHLPDATLAKLRACDADLFARGLVEYTGKDVANLMIIERSEFDPQPMSAEELLDFRVLTRDGWNLWQIVKQGVSDSAGRVMTGEIVNEREVHHSGLSFRSIQCCRECAEGRGLRDDEGLVQEIGPWYSKYYGMLMPGGWRLICPHSARPAGFVKRTHT